MSVGVSVWLLHLSVSASFRLCSSASELLFVRLCLSASDLSFSPVKSPSVHLTRAYLSVCLSVCLPACLAGWLAGCLSVCLSVSLSLSVSYFPRLFLLLLRCYLACTSPSLWLPIPLHVVSSSVGRSEDRYASNYARKKAVSVISARTCFRSERARRTQGCKHSALLGTYIGICRKRVGGW